MPITMKLFITRLKSSINYGLLESISKMTDDELLI